MKYVSSGLEDSASEKESDHDYEVNDFNESKQSASESNASSIVKNQVKIIISYS